MISVKMFHLIAFADPPVTSLKFSVLISVLDPDPYPDPDWIRIGSGFNGVPGSGSMRAKLAHKHRKKLKNFIFEVLDVLF